MLYTYVIAYKDVAGNICASTLSLAILVLENFSRHSFCTSGLGEILGEGRLANEDVVISCTRRAATGLKGVSSIMRIPVEPLFPHCD